MWCSQEVRQLAVNQRTVGSNPTATAMYGPLSQSAEESGLDPVQSEFESLGGYQEWGVSRSDGVKTLGSALEVHRRGC